MILTLKVTVNYHDDADPVDDPNYPFKIGTVAEFVLQSLPAENLQEGNDIVIYECNVSPRSNSTTRFAGAIVMYLKKGNSFVNKDGQTANLPPENYPQFQQMFQ